VQVIARRAEGAVAKAARRKVAKTGEPSPHPSSSPQSPKSLMARLAALQAEFAAKLQELETQKQEK
jgi:hypothetical protein